MHGATNSFEARNLPPEIPETFKQNNALATQKIASETPFQTTMEFHPTLEPVMELN